MQGKYVFSRNDVERCNKMENEKMSDLKKLRELTGASVSDCSKALKEAQEVSDSTDPQTIFGMAAGNLTWSVPARLLELASSINTSPMILAGLSYSRYPDVLVAVAKNPRTPEKTKHRLEVESAQLKDAIRKRDEGLNLKKERDRERTLSQLNARVEDLVDEVQSLRTALVSFSKAVSKRDQELVNAINRRGSYTVTSGFTVDFSQF